MIEEELNDVLSLTCRGYTEIPQDIAESKGNSVIQLDLTENLLSSFTSLSLFIQIETLILDKNELTGLDGLPKLPKLHTLWLNNNNISDLVSLCDVLEQSTPNLSYLSMMRNPACPEVYFTAGKSEAYRRFRTYVIYRLQSISQLDATIVTSVEKQDALLRGKFLDKVAKPKDQKEQDDVDDVALPQQNIAAHATEAPKAAAFLGKNRLMYDGRNSEGNRFILDTDL